MRFRSAFRCLSLTVLTIVAPIGSAWAISPTALASHTAVYTMELASVRPHAGIVGAGGTMTYTFSESCDGWTVETRSELKLLRPQGPTIRTVWDFLSWESKEGDAYRFRVRNTRNNRVTESYSGEARLEDSEGGEAVFEVRGEDSETVDLPPGTLFPTAHTLRLMGHAEAGQRFYAAPVFDGSSIESAFHVTVAIGNQLGADVAPSLPDQPLLTDSPAWPMTLAFFAPDAAESTPDFEVSLRYHMNGVAEQVLQNFGDFSLRGTLTSLKELAKPEC